MSDTDLRELEKLARAGDTLALEKLQHTRDRLGFSSADAAYLHEFVKIYEDVVSAKLDVWVGEHSLRLLNDEYKFLVGSRTLKTDFILPPTPDLFEDSGWSSSGMGC